MDVSFELELEAPGGPAVPESAADAPRERPPDRPELKGIARAVRDDPAEADYYFILGNALSRAGEHAAACAAYTDAVRFGRHVAAYHAALGASAWRAGRLEDACAAFREALALRAGEPRYWNGLGVSLLRLGRSREACDAIRRSLDLHGGGADLVGNLGAALFEHDPEAALRALREAVRQDPRSARHQRNLGIALAALERWEAALGVLREALRLRPGSAALQLDVADALAGLGRDAEAGEAYERASQIEPAAIAARPASLLWRQALIARRVRADLPRASSDWRWRVEPVLAGLLGLAGALRARPLRAAALVAGLVLAADALTAFGTPFVRHFLFADDVVSVARAPVDDDQAVRERLRRAVRRRGLERFVRDESCRIETRPGWRAIECSYVIPVRALGFERSLPFELRVEEPYLAPTPWLVY